MKLGHIGLGHMGEAIARRVAKAGHELVVWNRTATRAEALRSIGARVADSPAGACAPGIVFTSLSDDRAVEAVVFGERGVLAGLPQGGVHVSLSTISLDLVRKLDDAHRERGQLFLSAPVVGRPEAAETGKLLVLASGPKAALDRAKPVFDAIGRKLVHLGAEPTLANVAKLSVNFLFASLLEALGEAFALVRKSGFESESYLEIVNEVFQSPVYGGYGELIAHERFSPAHFGLTLGLKDVRLFLAVGDEKKVPLPLARLLESNFVAAAGRGMADEDWAALAHLAAENAGLVATTPT
jgi:3-hydroxyisobutyrate dehydrogenase-like beta-hydroxyacid dehydrogenase